MPANFNQAQTEKCCQTGWISTVLNMIGWSKMNEMFLDMIPFIMLLDVLFFSFMVFNANFNNISVILWQSFVLVQNTRVPGENHRSATGHWQTLSHNEYTSPEWDSNSQRLWGLVIGTDCIGRYKSNYHTIMTTLAPFIYNVVRC